VNLTALCAERIEIASFLPEIETATPRIIEKNSVSEPLPTAEKNRDGLVQRTVRSLPSERVGVPHRERAIAAIHRSRFVAQAIVTFFVGHLFPHAHAAIPPGHREIRVVGNQNGSGVAQKINQER